MGRSTPAWSRPLRLAWPRRRMPSWSWWETRPKPCYRSKTYFLLDRKKIIECSKHWMYILLRKKIECPFYWENIWMPIFTEKKNWMPNTERKKWMYILLRKTLECIFQLEKNWMPILLRKNSLVWILLLWIHYSL